MNLGPTVILFHNSCAAHCKHKFTPPSGGQSIFAKTSTERGWPTIDSAATTEQLEHVATLLPEAWLAPAATGSPERCVEKIMGQFDLGCDGVILHGASPAELEPILSAYRKARPIGRFDGLAANPAA